MKKLYAFFLSTSILLSSCGVSRAISKIEDKQEGYIDSSSIFISDSAADTDNIKNREITYRYMKTALDDYAAETMKCLTNHDVDGLKAIFTDRSIEELDLDTEIQVGFDFIGDEILSYGEIESHSLGSTFGGGHTSRLTGESYVYEVKTQNDVYEIFIGIVLVCDEDPSEVGIQNIKIYNSKYDIDDEKRNENMVSVGTFWDSWYE